MQTTVLARIVQKLNRRELSRLFPVIRGHSHEFALQAIGRLKGRVWVARDNQESIPILFGLNCDQLYDADVTVEVCFADDSPEKLASIAPFLARLPKLLTVRAGGKTYRVKRAPLSRRITILANDDATNPSMPPAKLAA